MDFLLTALILIALINGGSTKFYFQSEDDSISRDRVTWLYQKLDHFDPTNLQSWNQRYVVNELYFNDYLRSGPIFLLIGGEGPLNPEWAFLSAMSEYARKYNALIFGLEHRFYGESRPTPDLSVESLRYLSSEQALADIAYFISSMNAKYQLTPENKWVVFGGSYAGSLAAWARMKYPHLIHAAVSSSAPVLAKASVGYGEFAQQVFALSSKECADNVHQASLQVTNLLNQPGGSEILTKAFQLCEELNTSNSDDVYHFVESILGRTWDSLQANGRSGLDRMCEYMTEGQGDLLERYAAATLDSPEHCVALGTFEQSIQCYENISYQNSSRSWLYQTCTEFGFYPTSSPRRGFFGADLNLQLYIDTCKGVFGEQFNLELLNEGIERTNMMYGGLDIQVTRVLFVQGSLDPWSTLGIKKPKPDAPVIVIEGATHCSNMLIPSFNDSEEMRNAREQISSLIGEWLSVH